MPVSPRLLIILAAAVWYIGGVILGWKGYRLLATAGRESLLWSVLAFAGGVILGLIKSGYLFVRSCQQNIRRILSLKNPRIWQFYRPMFFLFLGLMILLGVVLNRMAQNSLPMTIGVGTLDISLAIALLTSSVYFFKTKTLES